jgi:hypothetical protein
MLNLIYWYPGLDHDGIYRINGNQAHIQKLRCQVDQGNNQDWGVKLIKVINKIKVSSW